MIYVGMSDVYGESPFETGEKVKASFRNEFPGETQVKWDNLGDYQRALFVFNGSRINAYSTRKADRKGMYAMFCMNNYCWQSSVHSKNVFLRPISRM